MLNKPSLLTVNNTSWPACVRLFSNKTLLSLFLLLPTVTVFAENNDTYHSEHKITDFQFHTCDDIVQNTQYRMTNVTYWQKLFDCAKQNTPRKNREIAKKFRQPIMPDALIWSILISRSEPSVAESLEIINLLTSNQDHIPKNILFIVDMLKELQTINSQFNSSLDESSQLMKELINERDLLKAELAKVNEKLNNLAEIERQISIRRQMQMQNQYETVINQEVPIDTTLVKSLIEEDWNEKPISAPLFISPLITDNQGKPAIPYRMSFEGENQRSNFNYSSQIKYNLIKKDIYLSLLAQNSLSLPFDILYQ